LLMGNTITNKKLSDFLNLKSPSAAKTILNSLNLQYQGTFKDRVYFLQENIELNQKNNREN
ncbi:hypothetical protein V7112_20255, partial [Bacillus sp. JJ1566]